MPSWRQGTAKAWEWTTVRHKNSWACNCGFSNYGWRGKCLKCGKNPGKGGAGTKAQAPADASGGNQPNEATSTKEQIQATHSFLEAVKAVVAKHRDPDAQKWLEAQDKKLAGWKAAEAEKRDLPSRLQRREARIAAADKKIETADKKLADIEEKLANLQLKKEEVQKENAQAVESRAQEVALRAKDLEEATKTKGAKGLADQLCGMADGLVNQVLSQPACPPALGQLFKDFLHEMRNTSLHYCEVEEGRPPCKEALQLPLVGGDSQQGGGTGVRPMEEGQIEEPCDDVDMQGLIPADDELGRLFPQGDLASTKRLLGDLVAQGIRKARRMV